MEKVVSLGWAIDDHYCYWITVVLSNLVIRAGLSFLRALKQAHEEGGASRIFLAMLWRNFRGWHPRDSTHTSDYWHPFILGLFELASYPILFATEAWAVIGAWIGLKTLAQWNVWKEDRATFNLFLLGNLAVILIALLVLRPQVIVP